MADGGEERLPFQKPDKRIKDGAFCTRYLRSHPRCECGCGKRSEQFHHIKSRKMGGSDVEENGLALRSQCHMLWHTIGGQEWFRRHQEQMPDDARMKVAAVLGVED